MKRNEGVATGRLAFFDNLRSLMVVLVLVFHAGASYAEFPPFWPFREAKLSEVVTHIMPLLDVFMMSVLFFVAGYFALPSLQKRGGKRFLEDKLKHLGIPWLVVITLVLPVLDYVHYTIQAIGKGLSPRKFGTHWWLAMKKIGEFRVGRMRMSGHLDMTEHFYQRYMWFLSLLLLFFVLFWLMYRGWERWGRALGRPHQQRAASSGSIYPALAVVGLCNVALFALAKALSASLENPFDMVWFSLGNVVQFEFAKLAFYVPYFALGVYAYTRSWFAGGRGFGRPWAWAAICFLLTGSTMLVARSMTRADQPSLGLQLVFAASYPLWTFSFLGVITALAVRYCNRPTPLSRELAANSYNMYLAHYVFALTLPLPLSTWAGGSALAKFGLVAGLTIVLSYGASRYIIRRYPRLAIIGLGGLSFVLAAFT